MRTSAEGSPDTTTLSGSDVVVVGNSRRRLPMWRAAAVVLLVVGTVGAVVAAAAVASNDTDRSRREFQTSSVEVASTLQLAIQHEQDLIVSAGGFVAGEPNATNTEFVQ